MRPLPAPEQALLAQLGSACYRGTFESHITIQADTPEERQHFRALCRQLGVKCVLIELPDGVTRSQPMTAHHHHGEIGRVVQELLSLCQKLRAEGFSISRVKLEAVATNDGIPHQDEELSRFPAGNYFEFHLKLALPAGSDLETLRADCARHGARLSRNALKTEQDERSERFVTLRLHGLGRCSAFARLDALEGDLTVAGFIIINRQREYILFDSAEQLDAGWIDRPPTGGNEP